MSDERPLMPLLIEVPCVGGPHDGRVVSCWNNAVPGERLPVAGTVSNDNIDLLDYVFDGDGAELVLRYDEWQGGMLPGGEAIRNARDDRGPDEADLARMRQAHEDWGATMLDVCAPGTHDWGDWQRVLSRSGNSTRRCKRCTLSQGRIF